MSYISVCYMTPKSEVIRDLFNAYNERYRSLRINVVIDIDFLYERFMSSYVSHIGNFIYNQYDFNK